jgi:hypothetical protein
MNNVELEMSTKIVNKQVSVTALYFSKDLDTFPKKIEFDGQAYTFMGGLQCLIKKGRGMVRLFNMTDGKAEYRLRYDQDEANWTLLAIANR